MNFFEGEMRQMFGGTDIIKDAKFTGRTMLGKLDDELRVKLEFVYTHTFEKYDAIAATIINRKDGLIDKQTFRFADIIGMYRHKSGSMMEPHMWVYGGPEWYTPLTLSQKAQIADTVLDYVSLYQSEDQSMGVQTM